MNLNKFKVSAPGNLSLFGEHAVEHGKSGIAAAVNLRTTLSFTELSELYSEGLIRLEFPQISLLVSISVQQFLDFYSHCKQDIKVLPDQVRRFVASNSHMYKTMNQEAIVRAFFYVLASVTFEQKINMKSIRIELSTELMMNSNFICLTPATVCFAACFLHWSYLQKDIDYHNTFDNYLDLKKICLYAAECEKTFYNSRSIGPSVCTYGSIIKYKIIDDYARVELFIDISNQIILLVDSKQTPSLEIQMQRLTELTNIHPKTASSIFNKIEFATDMASDALCHLNKLNYKSDADIEKHPSILLENNVLMTAIDMSQRLLQLLNVSHYHLNEICATAQRHGLCGKYTDISAGRYAYIWCQSEVSTRRIRFLSQELKANCFDVTETSVTSSGVKIE